MQEYAALSESIFDSIEDDNSTDALLSLDIRLRCPRCAADMERLDCPKCAFQIRMTDDIASALPPERVAHYARFIADYERIRASEGRGSQNDEFYLALPYEDTTGMNSAQWKIRARSFEYLCKHVLTQEGDHRRVLDLGAGNCWMSFRLALAGYQPVAVDLLTNKYDGLAAAIHYQRHLSEPFPRFQAELTHLPFQDGQFDTVVFNASFHYSEDYELTLREALRCLRSDGRVVIIDSPWYSREESGRQMVRERQAAFLDRFGTASDSIRSLEYLTNDRLEALGDVLSIRWTVHSPWYGFRWFTRPWVAWILRRRAPSRFRIYVATKKHE